MRILYAIQGTGNGHLSRARDIIPILQKRAEVHILISGTEADVEFDFPLTYRFKGLSFVFGKKGGVDLLATYKKSNLKRLYKEIKSLPIHEYDLVLNDFEPVSAWACRLQKKKCIGLSHQAAVLHPASPKPEKSDVVGLSILRHYAPVNECYGFHFRAYAIGISTPVIREAIRTAAPTNMGHYCVYLPAYDDARIVEMLREFPKIRWKVFSKHCKEPFDRDNISVRKINDAEFINAVVTCEGVLCGAGFETPAEALFLHKKLLVTPMKNQYEQQCNAAALEALGVTVIKKFKPKYVDHIRQWLKEEAKVLVNYPDLTEAIVNMLIETHNTKEKTIAIPPSGETIPKFKKFKQLSIQTLLKQLTR